MIRTRLLVATQLLALAAFAQTSPEFGRATGGEINAITKDAKSLSATLGLRHGSRGEGYEATFGGTLLQDRLWVFASVTEGFDVKATAQPVDWSNVTASFSEQRATPFAAPELTLPSSFLSLRSTTMLSDRMFVDVRVSRTTN